MREVIEAARRVTGREIPVEEAGRRAGDPPQLVAANARAREMLGWAPERSLETMIADAWAWHSGPPGRLLRSSGTTAAVASTSTVRGGAAASITANRSGSAAASAS